MLRVNNFISSPPWQLWIFFFVISFSYLRGNLLAQHVFMYYILINTIFRANSRDAERKEQLRAHRLLGMWPCVLKLQSGSYLSATPAAPLYLDCFFRAYRIFKVLWSGFYLSATPAAPLYLRSHNFLPNFFIMNACECHLICISCIVLVWTKNRYMFGIILFFSFL